MRKLCTKPKDMRLAIKLFFIASIFSTSVLAQNEVDQSLLEQTKGLKFVENKGQILDAKGNPVEDVLYKLEAPSLNLWVTTKGITYQFFELERVTLKAATDTTDAVKEKYINWNRVDMVLKNAKLERSSAGRNKEVFLGGNTHYLGNNPVVKNTRAFQEILFQNVYPGIDWVLYVKGDGVKHDFIVHPGANPNDIQLVYEGFGDIAFEANKIRFTNDLGELSEGDLYSYQEGKKVPSSFNYQRNNKPTYLGALRQTALLDRKEDGNGFSYNVSIDIEDYDPTKELVIDPVLSWGTLFGGNLLDGMYDNYVDDNDNVYCTGYVSSTSFPVLDQGGGSYYQGTLVAAFNGFVLKFNSNKQLLWGTYFGGASGQSVGQAIDIGPNGDIALVGYSDSPIALATTGGSAYQVTTNNGFSRDAFVAKFNANGTLIWSTLYGGSSGDEAFDVVFDQNSNLFVGGYTSSWGGFPLVNPGGGAYYQPTFTGGNGSREMFFAKFDANNALEWSTYFGGNARDQCHSIDVDPSGNLWALGLAETGSNSLVTLNSGGGSYFQGAQAGSIETVFMKFSNNGNLLHSSYLGGSGSDRPATIKSNSIGEIYIMNTTSSGNYPVLNPGGGAYYQGSNGGFIDLTLTKLDNNAVMLWSTYYGGTGMEQGPPNGFTNIDNMAFDDCDNLYISFVTISSNMPVVAPDNCHFSDNSNGGGRDCFLSKFEPNGNLIWSTYYGGSEDDVMAAIDLTSENGIIVTGEFQEYVAGTVGSLPLVNLGGGAYYDANPDGLDDSYVMEFQPVPLTYTGTGVDNTACICNGEYTIDIQCGEPPFTYLWSTGSSTINTMSYTDTESGLCPGNYWVDIIHNCDDTIRENFTILDNFVSTIDPNWTVPTGLCASNAPIDLSALVTGTPGGTFTGTGVTGTMFDPSVGSQTITYTVGTAPCDSSLAQLITIVPSADASWTAPTGLCAGNAPVDLSALITGTTGGTFTGTGITGNMFDPSVGSQTITYTVGTAPCDDALALQITVAPVANASWTAPIGLCSASAPVDLSTLITGTTGGTFSGTGITGNTFDPAVGTQTITYTVGTAPCDATLALQITIVPSADANWTIPTGLCSSSAPIDLSALVTGTAGGTFSGNGITGTMFDPSVGTQTITYTVGTAPCDAMLAQQITVIPQADATWTVPTGLCSASAPVDLSALITGTVGGTFSGAGITGTMFDPSVGTQTITYTVGTAPCDATLALQITILPSADATWTIPTGLCTSSAPIDLTTLITGTTGGTFSGIGVTGNMFDPSGGTQTITYTVGTAPCNDILAQQITIIPQADANWTVPTGLCSASAPIDLTTLIIGTTGGTFSGTGVTGTMFDPSVGTQTITYTVGTAPCDATIAQQIIIVPSADATWTLPTGLCTTGAPIDLSTFITGTAGGTFTGTGITGTFFDPSAGSQTITYSVGTAPCDATLAQQIIVDLPLSAGLDSTVTICGATPNTLDLNTLMNGADLGGVWLETTTSGQFNAAIGELALTGLAEGVYTFTYTQNANSNCATDIATMTVNYGIVGNAGLDGQVVVCHSNGLIDLFSLIGGNPDTGGTWTPSTVAGNGMFDPAVDMGGTYSYTVYSSPFCPQDTSKAIIDIINAANIQIVGPAELCLGDGAQAYTANVPSGTWSGQGMSNQGVFNPAGLNTGNTTITYTFDSLGCQSTTDFTITLNDVPTIEIFYDADLCEDGEQFIAPIVTNATNYYWSDGFPDLNRVIEGDFDLIDQTLQFTLVAENLCGNASENVLININQCNETVYVPNTFTPDGDEFNQTFKPVMTGIDVHSYQMIIFNRWGELIFETNNPEVGWDGTYGGISVQDGIYTWSLQYKLPNEDGNTRLVGHVNVIR